MTSITARLVMGVLAWSVLAAGSAAAVTKCKAKIDPKGGTISVSASDVTGTLH